VVLVTRQKDGYSQGWCVYLPFPEYEIGLSISHQAFRMMTDAGLHVDPQRLSKYESLTSIEIEARKRLTLSAYSWDKILSLTLGRPPTLIKLPISVDDICESTHFPNDYSNSI
jgi:hypothetical protein